MIIPAEGQLFLGFKNQKTNKNINRCSIKLRDDSWTSKKLPQPKEKDIELAICHYLRAKGIFFWKNPTAGFFDRKLKMFRKQTSPYAINGAPDLIAIMNGRFIGIEIKSPKGVQSEAQKDFERRCVKANGKYFLVRSLDDLETVLKGELNV